MSSEMRTASSRNYSPQPHFDTNLPFKCEISWAKWTHFKLILCILREAVYMLVSDATWRGTFHEPNEHTAS